MVGAFVTRILQAASLLSAIPQVTANGLSLLGTLDAPTLPDFLPFEPSSRISSRAPKQAVPWGSATVDTNPYTHAPHNGKTRRYDLTITRGTTSSPDGVERPVLLVNGQFPGPLLEANWGDTFQVTVHNNITGPDDGTTIHWHGFLQKGTPYNDGVPGISQCPIAPGKSFTYSFAADLYGTSWYHSHYSAQYADGIYGPMVVYGPTQAKYDIDIGPVLISDYYHNSYQTVLKGMVEIPGLNPPPKSDNNLINGKMDLNCIDPTKCTSTAKLSKFKFTSGKTHRLRLINPSSDAVQRFSIDDHTFTVIANDFVTVVPYNVSTVTLAPGQRSDVLVTANKNPKTVVWMRANISTICSEPNQPYSVAAVYYEGADTNAVPTSVAVPYDEVTCANDPLEMTVPYTPMAPPSAPAFTQVINITAGINATGFLAWFMNDGSFHGNYNAPPLLLAKMGNTSLSEAGPSNYYNFGKYSSVRIVINNPIPAGNFVSHPMHLHGHNFFVLADGIGEWDGKIVNPNNPQRRDTQLVQPGGYLVLEYVTDNPGVWAFHCHIAWHASQGLFAQFMEQPAQIEKINFPAQNAQTCRDWAAFTKTHVVDEIDSGL